jgi:hypothetical protein
MNKNIRLFFYITVFITCISLTSCIDKDYDLSDIDTNARFSVNDLVIPINLDEIELDGILDLKDNSKIKKDGDGYAFFEEGDFTSNSIVVKSFTTSGSKYQTSKSVRLISDNPSASPKRASVNRLTLAHADIKNSTAINISTADVDSSIISIDGIDTEMDINITLLFGGLTSYIKKVDIKDLEVQLLKGLYNMKTNIGRYDPETGMLDIGDIQTTTEHNLELNLHITKVDAKKIGITKEKGVYYLNDSVSVISGQIVVYQDQIKGSTLPVLPTYVDYTLSADISPCIVKSFSGRIKYNIAGINIDPINLTDIPDILSQKGTNIILENPQIYISVNNPLYQYYKLYAQTGLMIKGNETCQTTNGAIVLDQAENLFVLSPYNPSTTKYKGYNNAHHVMLPNLGEVLSGNKIPTQVDIKLLSPMIPEQNVTSFLLGETIPPVKGKWMLYAPLNLTTSSTIKYSKTWDNWQDKDLDGLTVEKAQISATITSDVPLTLDVSFTLLGRKGEMSGKASLAADTKDKVIVIPLTGTSVSEIYGLTIDVTTRGGGLISPSQKMIVKNLSAKVTGHYDREL